MVDDPLEWLRRLPKGIGYAVIHLEAIEDLKKTITWVRGMGVKVFVALSSETPTRAYDPCISCSVHLVRVKV